jgi:hypothetical protein
MKNISTNRVIAFTVSALVAFMATYSFLKLVGF